MDTNFFQFFQIFAKVETVLLYGKSLFSNMLYPASANEFSGCGNNICFGESYFAAISVIKR